MTPRSATTGVALGNGIPNATGFPAFRDCSVWIDLSAERRSVCVAATGGAAIRAAGTGSTRYQQSIARPHRIRSTDVGAGTGGFDRRPVPRPEAKTSAEHRAEHRATSRARPAPRAAEPAPVAPTPAKPKASDGPSLGEILRDSTPDAAKAGSAPSKGRGSVEELPAPAPRAPDLSPAPQKPFISPFDKLPPSEADRMDRDRLNSGRSLQDDYRPDSPSYGGGTDFLDPKAFSCDDFRKRIAAQTIDKISLDVSPPFRPDEFDMRRYEELKADFEERQVLREWISRDGRELAKGRLRDLAYENAVIETEDGRIERLPISRLSEGDIAYITENWGLPRECLLEQVAYAPRLGLRPR